ncbi:MAG TPA: helix-turn-helix domain-containing protein [Chitinophagaceae bacterium]
MIHPAATDIIELLNGLVNILQPLARSHGIVLRVEAKEKKLVLPFRPDLVICDLTNLICNIISYVPQENTITIIADKQASGLEITVMNTGINLCPVTEIIRSCKQPVSVKADKEHKQTCFSFILPVLTDQHQEKNNKPIEINKKIIPDYYDEIRKRLRSHFSKADTLVAQLSILYPKEAAFLQKVNAVIIANMDNELFDTSTLSKEMNMSRASLFRRLKPLIQQPPATYIKVIRLQKAKELLETTDVTVGEAAFKTGFQTQSHFSKAFAEMFGFLPSSIRRKNQTATKE